MDSARAFLQAIVEEPDNDAHRLIYADWLEEQGDAVLHEETDKFGVGVFGQIQPDETAAVACQAAQAPDRRHVAEVFFERGQHGLLNGPRSMARGLDLDQQGRLSLGRIRLPSARFNRGRTGRSRARQPIPNPHPDSERGRRQYEADE